MFIAFFLKEFFPFWYWQDKTRLLDSSFFFGASDHSWSYETFEVLMHGNYCPLPKVTKDTEFLGSMEFINIWKAHLHKLPALLF